MTAAGVTNDDSLTPIGPLRTRDATDRTTGVYHDGMTPDLFDSQPMETLREGIVLLRNFVSTAELLPAIIQIGRVAPPRQMRTPNGRRMSVAMTNCGSVGWVADRRGYRYSTVNPGRNQPWPTMPAVFAHLAHAAGAEAGFPDFIPDVCLINRYAPGARLGNHRDEDEQDFSHPIVSVSLGLTATFVIGGLTRRARQYNINLSDGDVLVFGGPSRLIYHGIKPLNDGVHPLLGACRVNLTFRKAT